MDALAITAKICGAVLFVWTCLSILRHFTRRGIKTLLFPSGPQSCTAPAVKAPATEGKKHSLTERFLNNLLLYLWFVFLLAFSIGLVVNN
jgi:hypothetical protein